MALPYKVLFLLASPTLTLLEIKRIDLPATTDKSLLYNWFQYEAPMDSLTRLAFVAMHHTPAGEQRTFEQGQLVFDKIQGTFTTTAGTIHHLSMRPDRELTAPMQRALAALLSE